MLILILLGSVQVSVQMEQDEPKNEIAPASTLGKEVEKNENLGKWNQKVQISEKLKRFFECQWKEKSFNIYAFMHLCIHIYGL